MNLYCEGHDVKCALTGLTLGDIKGYDGKICDICIDAFINVLAHKIARSLFNEIYN